MPTTIYRVSCETCHLGSSIEAWRENQGYCPKCQQPGGDEVMQMLHMSPSDLKPNEESPPGYRGSLDLDDRYFW
jgi:hypothetical protein